jgi:hypothetical protein
MLAQQIFELDEPWRSHFLAMITAQMAGKAKLSGAGDLCEPNQSELARWLCDRALCQWVRSMLRAWTRV